MAIESKDLKAKANETLRQIRTAKNIHAPDKKTKKLKNEIINGLKGILDENIRKQIRELTDSFPYILLVGNSDKTLLAACYAYCDRDIDQSNKIKDLKQFVANREKEKERNKEKYKLMNTLNEEAGVEPVKERIETDDRPQEGFVESSSNVPYTSSKGVQQGVSPEDAISRYIRSLNQLIYKNCFNTHLLPSGDDVNEWMCGFRSGYTVFLRSFESNDNDQCRKFAKSIQDVKITKPRDNKLLVSELDVFFEDTHKLFIVSTDSINNLPDYLREEFEVISLDDKETIVKPSGVTIESEVEQQEEKVEKPPAIFRKKDDFYTIRYEDESFTLKATDGLRYIHYLLEHPYDPYSPRTKQNKFIPRNLYKETHKLPPADKDALDTLKDIYRTAKLKDDNAGITLKGYGDYTEEVVDQETKQKIKELEDEKELAESAGNEEKAGEIQGDIDKVKREYVKYLRRGGQSLKFPSSFHKRPYDNISQAIDIVYKKIKKYSEENDYNSMLTWRHLSSSIKFKNSYWFYEPDPLNPPTWLL